MSKRVKVKCVIATCKREVRTRGLCQACYMMAFKYVTQTGKTWEEMAELGLCVSPVRTKRSSPFTVALLKATEQKQINKESSDEV